MQGHPRHDVPPARQGGEPKGPRVLLLQVVSGAVVGPGLERPVLGAIPPVERRRAGEEHQPPLAVARVILLFVLDAPEALDRLPHVPQERHPEAGYCVRFARVQVKFGVGRGDKDLVRAVPLVRFRQHRVAPVHIHTVQ